MDEIGGFWLGARQHAEDVDLRALAEDAGGWEALLAGGVRLLEAHGVDRVRAEAWLRTAPSRTRGTVLTLADERYPARLRQVSVPPPFVVVEGDLAALDRPAVAVVGTRACTAYGRGIARHLGSAIAAAGGVVVSGLARGIDAEAHKGTLGVGVTAAVLGHGLSFTAPSFHRHLRHKILEEGGVLLTTWPDEVPPRPHRFPDRNRWIAALADHVVIVEAPVASGALHTARFAAEASRDVWAVPGPIGRQSSAGCLGLLAAGADILVDVEQWVSLHLGGRARAHDAWLGLLFTGESVDEVARRSQRSTAELLAELSLLELQGRVVRLPGQRYAPVGSAA